MNRDNGALIGFYNTSYKTPMTNWTDFTDIETNDGGDDEDTLIVDSSQPKLEFLEDELVKFTEKEY